MDMYFLTPLFFLVALCYSSVGFGGGSSYLALLTLSSISYSLIPTTALICNIIVVMTGCYFFSKNKYLELKFILPFLITSLPMAYIGGRLPISEKTFFIFLGVSLFIAGTRLFLDDEKCKRDRVISKKEIWLLGLPLGTVLGFVSGITGIGGGIFLAPILYFLGWTHAKTVAASASLFILLNSLSGLLGQLIKNQFEFNMNFALPLMIAVFCGGQVGSRFCVTKFSFQTLKKFTASLVIVVSLRILVNIII